MTKLKIFYERTKSIELIHLVMTIILLSVFIFSTVMNIIKKESIFDEGLILLVCSLVFFLKFFFERKDRKKGKEIEEIIECKKYEEIL